MKLTSLQAAQFMEGGCTTADITSLKGRNLSTVLLAHLSHAEGSELYKILISLQVSSQPIAAALVTLPKSAHVDARPCTQPLYAQFQGTISCGCDVLTLSSY